MIRIVFLIGLITLSTSTSTLMKQAPKPASGCIWAYSECNFQGTKKEICGNLYSFFSINFNDQMSSLQVGDFTTATIWTDVGYGGQKYVIQKSIKCLSCSSKFTSLNKQASSASVFKRTDPADGCIIAYSDCNYGGTPVEFCSDSLNLANQGMDLSISSVKVSRFAYPRFYAEINFQGNPIDITTNTNCFLYNTALKPFNDKARSIKIFREKVENK